METGARAPALISMQELLGRLAGLAASAESGLLAFDGDGTLWAGDVGEDVFHAAVRDSLLRAEAHDELRREATTFGVSSEGSPSAIAARLFTAYVRGTYPERDACAMMTWCYAGLTLAELAEFAASALDAAKIEERLHRELSPIFEFARTARLRVVVVSASPQPIVEYAASLWGIAALDVAASRATVEAERIGARLALPVPYAEAKLSALRTVRADGVLLASFGDNVFDIELLRAARLGVAVRPKPALRLRLADLPEVSVLDL